MEWWSIGFLAGALFVMITLGIGGYIKEKVTDVEKPEMKVKPRYTKEEVLMVLCEFRRYACKYESEVLDQLIDDLEKGAETDSGNE